MPDTPAPAARWPLLRRPPACALRVWGLAAVLTLGACQQRQNPPPAASASAAMRATVVASASPAAVPVGSSGATVRARPLASGVSVAPSLRPRELTEVLHGIRVSDPYRFLETTQSPDVAQWMRGQADHAQRTLARVPGRAGLLDALRRYDDAVPARVAQVTRTAANRWFFERRGSRDNQFKLYMREGLTGRDRLIFDPEVLARRTGKPHAINFFSPSPNGRHVALGVSRQGSETALLHLIDTQTGRSVGTPIERASFGGLAWSPDSKTLLFNRLQLLPEDAPATDRYQRSRVWRLRVGSPPESAEPVFGTNVPGVFIRPAEIPVVQLSHDGRWAFGLVLNGTQRELGVYIAPQAEVLEGRPRWRRFLDTSAQVTAISYFNNALYTLSHRDAPRSKISVVPLPSRREISTAAPMASTPARRERVVVSQTDRILTGMAAASDALYIEARDGNTKRLFKLGHAPGAALREVRLPIDGAFSLQGDDGTAPPAADPRLPGVVLALESWTQARQIVQVSADGHSHNTGLQPAGPNDAPAHLAVTEVRVPVAPGVLVPMSLIHRKGLVRDGSNPTLLYGYAAYGVTEEPFFSHSRLAWLDAGGIFAVANPRGSGVYGEDWYRAGFQQTKHRSWEDFIACAQYLVAQGYTRPDKLGILGNSAGAILVGRALTERPDLFAAVVSSVGALDMVRGENTPNGIPNIPEFGSSRTEDGLRARLAMSTYHQIREQTPYPAVLLTHGVNDARVEVWHSTKTAARLQAASTSGKPVLLRLDYDAGHGVGSTKEQILRERADIYSFLLWQMGQPGFQPPGADAAAAVSGAPGALGRRRP